MSKAITKACETCDGTGATSQWDPKTCRWPRADCVDCSGTGRVPDVEAWWRGQVDAVTAQRDELREAADDVMRAAPAPTDLRLLLIGSNATPNRNSDLFDQVDKYEVARQRLRAAVDGAR